MYVYENRVLCSERKEKLAGAPGNREEDIRKDRQLTSLADEAPGSGVMVCRRSNGRGTCGRQHLG